MKSRLDVTGYFIRGAFIPSKAQILARRNKFTRRRKARRFLRFALRRGSNVELSAAALAVFTALVLCPLFLGCKPKDGNDPQLPIGGGICPGPSEELVLAGLILDVQGNVVGQSFRRVAR